MKRARTAVVLAAALIGATGARAFALGVTLTSSLPSGQPVGTVVLFAATPTDPYPMSYRFEYRALGDTGWTMLRDYEVWPVFNWAPIDEGTYQVRVTAAAAGTGDTYQDTMTFAYTSRITIGQPVVTPTANPLVALYSAPPCFGGSMQVRFSAIGSPFWQTTPARPCVPGKSVNFYIAGMRPNAGYRLQQQWLIGRFTVGGPLMSFQTGHVTRPVQNYSVEQPVDASTSLQNGVLLTTYVVGEAGVNYPIATDLAGHLIWYYDTLGTPAQIGSFIARPVAGGTFLVIMKDQSYEGQVLREIDLAGNVVRETHARRVSRQLMAMGLDPITSFHHEAQRLPNGHTIVLGSVERLETDVQGPGTLDVLGDMVIDLDQNLQVVWAWDAFDHLDVSRAAVLGESCQAEGPGCPPLFLADTANDWLHSNSLYYDPTDGNIMVSMRHQDWVVKIDYANGTGTGDVIWRLGQDGDFQLVPDDPSDPWPWFSHQHEVEIEGGQLLVYDNGNTRVTTLGGGDSRGQVWALDEANRVATLVHDFDLGEYSFALGSAQLLSNGNYHFLNGFVDQENPHSRSIEVGPDGQFHWVFYSDGAVYRSFRMRDLYTP